MPCRFGSAVSAPERADAVRRRITDAGRAREARRVAPHLLAKRGIALASARQRVEHRSRGNRPSEHGLIGENQTRARSCVRSRARCRRGRYGLTPRACAVVASIATTKNSQVARQSPRRYHEPRGQHDICKAHGTRFAVVRLRHVASRSSTSRWRSGCAARRVTWVPRRRAAGCTISGRIPDCARDASAAKRSSATSIESPTRTSSACSIGTKQVACERKLGSCAASAS